jgi:HSP20 family molecular chaperone IbpA
MKRAFILLALCATVSPVWAANNQQDAALEQAKADYRVYLQQLGELSKQYGQVTGEMKKVIKEEGIPVFDEDTGQISISHDIDFESNGPIEETDKEYRVTVDLAGARKSSIKAYIEDDKILHVEGIKRVGNKDKKIEKKVELPAAVSDKKPRAKYEDGLLTVTIRKPAVPIKMTNVAVE